MTDRLPECPHLNCTPLARGGRLVCCGLNGTQRACITDEEKVVVTWEGDSAWEDSVEYSQRRLQAAREVVRKGEKL